MSVTKSLASIAGEVEERLRTLLLDHEQRMTIRQAMDGTIRQAMNGPERTVLNSASGFLPTASEEKGHLLGNLRLLVPTSSACSEAGLSEDGSLDSDRPASYLTPVMPCHVSAWTDASILARPCSPAASFSAASACNTAGTDAALQRLTAQLQRRHAAKFQLQGS